MININRIIANFISSQNYISKNYPNVIDVEYIPTEAEIRASHQTPLIEIIQPIKIQFDNAIKDIIDEQITYLYYKFKNNNKEEIFNLIINEILNIDYLSKFQYNLYLYKYFTKSKLISPEQIEFEVKNYINEYFRSYIKKKVKIYLNRNNKSYMDLKEKELKNYEKAPYIKNVEELYKVNRYLNINETVYLDPRFSISYKNRDLAFIFLYDEAYISKSNDDYHENIMQRLMIKYNIDDKYFFNPENLIKNKVPYAIGHIYWGIALIDYILNTTEEIVKQALMKKNIKSVYNYNHDKKSAKKLAKKI